MSRSTGKTMPVPQLENLPSVTMSMLMDRLEAFNIVVAPSPSRRIFRWFASPFTDDVELPEHLRSGQVLYFFHSDNAREALVEDANMFACIVLAPDEGLPDWTSDFEDRIVVVQPTDSFMFFIYMVQCYFMNIALWENKMDFFASQPNGLQLLLESSESILDEFILCYDEADQVLAYTPDIKPPTKALQIAVESEHYQPEADERVADGDAAGSKTDAKSGGAGPKAGAKAGSNVGSKAGSKAPGKQSGRAAKGRNARVRHDDERIFERPVVVDGLRFATVLLQSTEPVSQGTRDMLEMMCRRVDIACKALWHTQVKSTNPYHFFFARLIEGTPCGRDDIAEQLDGIGIPPQHQLKLLLFDIEAGREPALSFSELAPAVKRINHGDCYYFAYQGYLCLLCYAVAGDSQLSDKKTTADVEKYIAKPYGIPASASMIFEDITDLDLAYKQALIAHNLRHIIEDETTNSADSERQRSNGDVPMLIPFEACVIYYLVGARKKDDRFLDFIFSHTLMQKISEEDRQNGTNNLEIFWEYISSERNASIVAEHMHVHRNTVRYRIDKLERRFDLDLSSQQVREKMIIDFKVFFLMQQRASIRQLFEGTV